MNITVSDYQKAIKHALKPRQIEILQILYSFPSSTATANELAKVLHPSNPAPIVASGQIGRIDKFISVYLNITPTTYNFGKTKKPAYFLFVGPYYQNEGKDQWTKTGWTMTKNLQTALERLDLVSKDKINTSVFDYTTAEAIELDGEKLLKEGKAITVTVNRYERNLRAKTECIKQHGDSCYFCNFNFGKAYGKTAEGHIHVHHIKPLSEIKKNYIVNPINDLIPVCPNCHVVIHMYKPALTIKEMKKLMLNQTKKKKNQ